MALKQNKVAESMYITLFDSFGTGDLLLNGTFDCVLDFSNHQRIATQSKTRVYRALLTCVRPRNSRVLLASEVDLFTFVLVILLALLVTI